MYTASVDERLDERGYIVPGMGDAGDRLFGRNRAALTPPGASLATLARDGRFLPRGAPARRARGEA